MMIYYHLGACGPTGLRWLLLSGKATHASHKHNFKSYSGHVCLKYKQAKLLATIYLLTWDWQYIIISKCNQYFRN